MNEIKKALKNYKKTCFRIEQIEEELKLLDTVGELSSIELKERVQTSKCKGSTTEDDAIKRTEISNLITELTLLKHEKKTIDRLLETLKEEDREIMKMYFFYDYKQTQIGQKLYKDRKTISNRIKKIIENLSFYLV